MIVIAAHRKDTTYFVYTRILRRHFFMEPRIRLVIAVPLTY